MQSSVAEWNLLAGWIATLAGIVSGAVMGLFFLREEWLGGYSSHRRRLLRLGHISFFGLGFTNVLFGLTARTLPCHSATAAVLMIVSSIAMPTCCFLTAWRKWFRVLFPLPVASAAVAVMMLLMDWKAQ